MKGTKIVVVGLDGATWDLLEPWSLEGKLPNLKELMKESCWGTLKSTIPPSTAPAWTSLSTGKNPGKHGVFDFVRLEGSSLRFLTSRDIRADPIYDILSKKGLRNVVIGLPLSFPPSEDFNGIMISNWLYPKKRIFPQTMKDLIKEYRVTPNVLKKGEDLLEDIIGTARSQVKVAKKLFLREKWDFYFFYYRETDLTFHKFWNDIKNSTSLGKKVIRVFQIVDEFVGWLLDHMDEKTYLFLVSDHGFGDCPLAICLNLVLAKKGLLRIKSERVSEANQDLPPALKLACRKMKIISIPKPLFELATHPLIKPVSKMLFKSIFGEESFINFMKKVEFENSRAFVPTSNTMGIFVREPDETKKKRTIKDLVSMLKDLKYKDQNVFRQVLLRNEVFNGPFTRLAPDILLIPNGFQILSDIMEKTFIKHPDGGYHDPNGIFLSYGPSIKRGTKIEGAKIYDIAPTILQILELPIPSDMDGRILHEIFEENSRLTRPKTTVR